MKHVSSQPLLCVLLFVAGCLCFLVALNPEWLSGEPAGTPSGGGRIPGLEPPKKPAGVIPEDAGEGAESDQADEVAPAVKGEETEESGVPRSKREGGKNPSARDAVRSSGSP